MPGWHDATEGLREQGEIRTLGVIQEQHPERARLFMQWKEMDWPLLVDSLNLLEVPFVPITLLVDEEGRARRAPRLRSAEEIERFVRGFVEGGGPGEGTGEEADAGGGAAASATLPVRPGAGPISRLETAELEKAIGAYRELLAHEPEDPGGWSHFRLGVLLRARYDSPLRQPGDFQAAVDHWRAALERDPNNYIFRRRIQQYGPRLDKPYPFYDWVETARREIRARGEEPVELTVLPGGAEIARPRRAGEGAERAAVPAQPDPEGRIHRDEAELVSVETTVVPGTRTAQDAAIPLQVHLAFHPDGERKVHWNNEAEGLTVWLEPPPGVTVEPRKITVPNPPEVLSEEIRQLSFEAEVTATDGELSLPGYALYYICEDVDGICLYRRQDLAVEVPPARE